ncbi:hypothetical protein CHS0354_039639 [Potamilus streckersoni]|uniref:Uncharacterized protein n=1 Tax=Potamilus streckersoni TaxID=2493646 RepID=A0AAE0SKE8_9BIVA|nr:hypothetical protein CHS0354_039639 [Potamilus streckersoni]
MKQRINDSNPILDDTVSYVVHPILNDTVSYIVHSILDDTVSYVVHPILNDTVSYVVHPILDDTISYVVHPILDDTVSYVVHLILDFHTVYNLNQENLIKGSDFIRSNTIDYSITLPMLLLSTEQKKPTIKLNVKACYPDSINQMGGAGERMCGNHVTPSQIWPYQGTQNNIAKKLM